MKVDKKVQVQEDNIEECAVTGVVVREEGEGGAEVEDVVEPMDMGDVAVQVLPNLQISSGEIQLWTFL